MAWEQTISVAGGRLWRMRKLFQWAEDQGDAVCGKTCSNKSWSKFFATKGSRLRAQRLTFMHAKFNTGNKRRGIFNLTSFTKINSASFEKWNIKIKIQWREPLNSMYRIPTLFHLYYLRANWVSLPVKADPPIRPQLDLSFLCLPPSCFNYFFKDSSLSLLNFSPWAFLCPLLHLFLFSKVIELGLCPHCLNFFGLPIHCLNMAIFHCDHAAETAFVRVTTNQYPTNLMNLSLFWSS